MSGSLHPDSNIAAAVDSALHLQNGASGYAAGQGSVRQSGEFRTDSS
jgi:hypothetical protein